MSNSNYVDVDAILSQCSVIFDFKVNQLFKINRTVYTVTPWHNGSTNDINRCNKCALSYNICGIITCSGFHRKDRQDVIVVVNPIDK